MPKLRRNRTPAPAGRLPRQEEAILYELAQLDRLNIATLRDLWRRRFRSDPPPIQSGDVLRRLIAWRLQVQAFGDLDQTTAATVNRLMRAENGKTTDALPARSLRPGTVLVREWRGVEQRVLVLESGFEHRRCRYQSLTEVARAITGTRWSGPRFFGLETKQLPKTAGTQL